MNSVTHNPETAHVDHGSDSSAASRRHKDAACASPAWMKWTLVAAGIYNLVWGAWTILMPQALFAWAGMEPPRYPEIWQCVGMIVGVYGVGYLAAATDPARHWPITLVGLMGKIFGPIGFVQAVATGAFAAKMGLTILTNDLIWWVPFVLILRNAWRVHYGQASNTHAKPVASEPVASEPGASDPRANEHGRPQTVTS